MPGDYEAFLIPDPGNWIPPDGFWPGDVGTAWLAAQDPTRALVVPTVRDADELRVPNGTTIVTPRSRGLRHARSVLVCFADDAALIELGERLRPAAMCVTDFGSEAVRAWAAKHDPQGWIPADWQGELPDRETPVMPEYVVDRMQFVIDFDSHNQFVGAGGKVTAIRELRRIHEAHPEITPAELETWLLTRPGVKARGAARLRKWHEEIRRGVRHLDYGRRPID